MIISEEKHRLDGLGSYGVCDIMRPILASESEVDRGREHFWVLGLDVKNVVQYIELVSLGSLTTSIVHPRETFRLAILKGVASVVLCHNHPSGDPTPSQEDRLLTKRLIECGDLLGVSVKDHVILGDTSFFSFERSGLRATAERLDTACASAPSALAGAACGKTKRRSQNADRKVIRGPLKKLLDQEKIAVVRGTTKDQIIRDALRLRDLGVDPVELLKEVADKIANPI